MKAVSKGYVKLFTKNIRFFFVNFLFLFFFLRLQKLLMYLNLTKRRRPVFFHDINCKFVNVVMALMGQSRFLGF